MQKTYWNNKGKYQKEYDEIKKKIPARGMGKTIKAELLTCGVRLYHDVYQNGLCNDKTYELEFINRYFGEAKTQNLEWANEVEGYGVDFWGSERVLKKQLEELEGLMDRIILEVYNK